MRSILLLALGLALAVRSAGLDTAAAPPAGAVPLGPGALTVDVGVSLQVFTYKPPTYRGGPLIVVFHGVGRNAEEYRNFAITLGERFGAIVAAPLFDKERFPVEAYQRGGILKDGVLQPREAWTYALVPRLVEALRAREGQSKLPFYFVGHSAGGQFVVRMAAMAGPLGASGIVAANPGSHLFPTREAAFGYGFGGLPAELSDDAALRRYLATPLTLYLGTADTDEAHASLDRSEPAMRQGKNRYERGLNCFAVAERLARQRGWTFAWRKVATPGVGHVAAEMFAAPAAELALFGDGTIRK